MALDTATILAQIDEVLGRGQQAAQTRIHGVSQPAEAASVSSGVTAMVAALDRLLPAGHQYRTAARAAVEKYGVQNSYTAGVLIGTLDALRGDVEAGYTQSLVELVHADLFADFLAMADELQRNGFKDAAAVIAGSTLEEQLRKLASKSQLPTTNPNGEPLKASRLNDDLKAAQVYNPLQHRSVQAWLDIRNAAAHAKYDEYDHAQVAGMIQSVGDFMTRHPA